MDTIIEIVKTLEDKGYAYAKTGMFYFRTKKFQDYGKLSHMPLGGAGRRKPDRCQRPEGRTPWTLCFVEGCQAREPVGNPLGMGCPGWQYIECTAGSTSTWATPLTSTAAATTWCSPPP